MNEAVWILPKNMLPKCIGDVYVTIVLPDGSRDVITAHYNFDTESWWEWMSDIDCYERGCKREVKFPVIAWTNIMIPKPYKGE